MSKQLDKTNILNYLKEHYSEFQEKYDLVQIGIFGSYARDEASENSDIDIFVKMKPTLSNYVDIKEELETAFENKVDIVRIRDKMNPYLLKRIQKDGVYVL
ncbi:nucleotidyltransferase family protein [Arcobacteraceae bacterium]|nr:nucleotidyltransferase family protein [Arcobacteraceae bacterium]